MNTRIGILIACLVTNAMVFAVVGTADSNVMLDQLVDGLQNVEEKISTLKVACENSSKLEFFGANGGRPDKGLIEGDITGLVKTTQATWAYRNDGSLRFEGTTSGKTMSDERGSPSGASVVISVFDGVKKMGKHVVVNENAAGELDWIEEIRDERIVSSGQESPLEFVTEYLGQSIANQLENHEAKITGHDRLHGRRLAIAQTGIEKLRPNYHSHHRFWIDAERNVVVRRQTFARLGADKPWCLHLQRDCKDFQQDENSGLWLPRSATSFNWAVTATAKGRLTSSALYSYRDWKVNPTIDPSAFSLDASLLPVSRE